MGRLYRSAVREQEDAQTDGLQNRRHDHPPDREAKGRRGVLYGGVKWQESVRAAEQRSYGFG